LASGVMPGAALAVLIASAAPAHAQGHRGAPPGQLKKTSPPAPSAAAPAGGGSADVAVVAPIQPRTFGMWLDDATLAPPGSVWLTAAATAWSVPAGHGVDIPAISVAAGLTPRAQLSLAVPVSHVSSSDGTTTTGMGNVYAGVKFLIVQRSARHDVGISTTPTLEILSGTGLGHRANLVLPVSAEFGNDRTRVYGSAGVFTRGAAFVSGALERHLSPTVSVTGALLQSWSTADKDVNDALGLHRTRTDIAGSVTAFLSPSIAAFGQVGRTISPHEFDSADVVVSGGVAFVLTPPSNIPIRPPR
jgi:hypothetical protein